MKVVLVLEDTPKGITGVLCERHNDVAVSPEQSLAAMVAHNLVQSLGPLVRTGLLVLQRPSEVARCSG